MSYLFGVSKTLCHELVDVFLTEFPSFFKATWVRFPTRDELPEMAREFVAIKGVPVVVGAVDGTHIHMKGIEGHRADAYDMRVFKESALLERLHNGDIAPYQIVGDAAYPLREYCLTPLHAPREEDVMDDWAQCFNYCQSATRMAMERCIRAFKGRWRIFGGRNDCRLWRILAGAACCVILHNMCEEMAVVRRKNMAWFNLPRNRNPWWTRGAIATHKWEPCVPPTQQALRERRKRLVTSPRTASQECCPPTSSPRPTSSTWRLAGRLCPPVDVSHLTFCYFAAPFPLPVRPCARPHRVLYNNRLEGALPDVFAAAQKLQQLCVASPPHPSRSSHPCLAAGGPHASRHARTASCHAMPWLHHPCSTL
ncbi:unnamed protein product [Closterium sp. NIES-53]